MPRKNWSKPMAPSRKHGPPTIIHVSLWRSGIMSMTRAYETLGLRPHHAHDLPPLTDRYTRDIHAQVERAAEGNWPSIPGVRQPAPPPFTRTDWDSIFSEYDVITDMCSPFVAQLIAAYPEAKVVIVQRAFEKWWPSFESMCVNTNSGLVPTITMSVVEKLTGFRGGQAAKMMLGLFKARNVDEVKRNAKMTWVNYHEEIRKLVPPVKRLEFRLSDGWEPLCNFLGKEVPDLPFPRVNDRAELAERQLAMFKELIWVVLIDMKLYILGALLAVIAAMLYKGL